MKYSDFSKQAASEREKQAFLIDGETTTITIRLPRNLKEAAVENAALNSMSFSSYIRGCLLRDLLKL